MTTISAAQIDQAKLEALGSYLKAASKDLKTRVTLLSDSSSIDVESISTGAITLDHALGIGGLPRGRVTELYGPTGGGKTTVALSAAKQCQDAGGLVAFIDAENSLNAELVDALGIDRSRFVIMQPDSGEHAVEGTLSMVESGLFDMIIVDSVAAMVPRAELDAEVEQQHMGLQARMLSKFMRLVTRPTAKHNVALVLINQVRSNLGAYGAPEESAGGKAIKFFASVRIEVRTSAGRQIKQGTKVIGTTVQAKVVKNKFAAPFRIATYDLIFGEGIDTAGGVFDVGLDIGVIEKSGNTYSVVRRGADLQPVDFKLAVGRDNAKTMLRDDEELFEDVTAAVRAKLTAPPEEPAPLAADEVQVADTEQAATADVPDEELFAV